ncbi:major facilitator superfamily domain-containing protein 12 [Trichonephila clavata]|uniref:Major facilitator superfamily domain-containing protein 12 n=1 Tax=Trichonephila clavata TaxID=2740835 RepID=A0A8X6KZF0_TRICU|nr:major facilitator superfamily domain-containing protein 12 [Trichonephila clavata]
MSFWDKMANGIAGMIIQHMHAVLCKDCDWFYRNVMSYGVGGVGIVASIVIVTLLPANLGERQSTSNGAVLTPKEEVINIRHLPTEEKNETQPLLPK